MTGVVHRTRKGQGSDPSVGRAAPQFIKMGARYRMPPLEFIDHGLDYLRCNPNVLVITPLGPNPLRVRLTLNSLVHKWIDHVAMLSPYRSTPEDPRAVIQSAIRAGLPVLEAPGSSWRGGR